MYACLFGEYPVSATKDHISMANKVLNHKFHLPFNGYENNVHVKELLYRLLEKNPNQRLCTLDELRQTSFMSNINFDRIYGKFYSPIKLLMNSKIEWYEDLKYHYAYQSPTRKENIQENHFHSLPTNPYENIDYR